MEIKQFFKEYISKKVEEGENYEEINKDYYSALDYYENTYAEIEDNDENYDLYHEIVESYDWGE